jgi:c-di-GMP-binding flagellar brake protein YcgR
VQVAVEQGAVQRRRYVRVKSPDVLVAWQGSTTRRVSRLETLGLGGMFVLTRQPPPLSSMVKLLLDLPLGEVRACGVVRRINSLKGMGVEFVSMSQEGRARLSKSLARMSVSDYE